MVPQIVIIHRRPTVVVTVDGSEVPDVTDVSYGYGFDPQPAKGSFSQLRLSSWVAARAAVTIAAGATDATTFVRHSGQIFDFPGYQLAPRSVQVDCRGHLAKAQTTLVGDETDDPDVPGVPLNNLTQKQQIVAAFNASGMAGFYNPALIGGPNHILGSEGVPDGKSKGSANANVWKRNRSALSFALDRDKSGLGYRIVEGPLPGGGFGVYRPQISPRPAPIANVTLSGAVDVGRDSSASHNDALDVFNRVVIVGGDYGAGPAKWVETAPHPHPDPLVPFQTAPVYQAPLCEQKAEGDHAKGISAQEVALWRILEECQVILKAEVSTPRSDLFRLEQTVFLSLFDRFEIAQTMWLRAVSGSVKRGQVFKQRLSLRAPAMPGIGGVLLPQERSKPYALGWAVPVAMKVA